MLIEVNVEEEVEVFGTNRAKTQFDLVRRWRSTKSL